MALDSDRSSPPPVSSTGTRPFGLTFFRNPSVRVSPQSISYSIRSNGIPSYASSSGAL
jgi:hypothetical protein